MSNKKTTAAKAAKAETPAANKPAEFPVISSTVSEDGNFSKTTRAIPVPGGVVLQVSTTHKKDGVATACSDSTVFVPNAVVVTDAKGSSTLEQA